MSALSTTWTLLRAHIHEREDGLVAIEYVILGALCAALIGTGMVLFMDELNLKFQAIF
jgi:Flp pilus assembly pilin Flp